VSDTQGRFSVPALGAQGFSLVGYKRGYLEVTDNPQKYEERTIRLVRTTDHARRIENIDRAYAYSICPTHGEESGKAAAFLSELLADLESEAQSEQELSLLRRIEATKSRYLENTKLNRLDLK
jgi:hypothetical protein